METEFPPSGMHRGEGGKVLLVDSFHRFSGKHLGELHKISVCRGSPHEETGWRSLCFVLCLFIYLFIICLFIVCLCVCFLIIFKELVLGSFINYVV